MCVYIYDGMMCRYCTCKREPLGSFPLVQYEQVLDSVCSHEMAGIYFLDFCFPPSLLFLLTRSLSSA